jgi:hypothetical protein
MVNFSLLSLVQNAVSVPSPVEVMAQSAPSSVASSVATYGPQGPPGVSGPAGPQGASGDYGAIRYDEVNATPFSLTPGIAAPFTLAAPVTNTNSLRGPFEGFVFLSPDGRTLHARANGDADD